MKIKLLSSLTIFFGSVTILYVEPNISQPQSNQSAAQPPSQQSSSPRIGLSNKAIKKTMVLTLVLIMIIVGALVILQLRGKNQISESSNPPTVFTSPPSTGQTQQNAVSARPKPKLSILYGKVSTGSAEEVFKWNLYSNENKDTNLSLDESKLLTPISVSPDGLFVARWINQELDISPSDSFSFSPIFKARDINEEVDSLIWSKDDSKLAVNVSKHDKNSPFPISSKIYIMNRDGSQPKVIQTLDNATVTFLALDQSKSKLYYLNGNTGGIEMLNNFTVTDFSSDPPKTNTIDNLSYRFGSSKLTTDVSYGTFSSDLETFYYPGGEYSFTDLTKKSSEVKPSYPMTVSPINKIYYTKDNADKSTALYSYDITQKQSTMVSSSVPTSSGVGSISPDGNFLWLSQNLLSRGYKYYIYNLAANSISEFPPDADNIEFLGWINSTTH